MQVNEFHDSSKWAHVSTREPASTSRKDKKRTQPPALSRKTFQPYFERQDSSRSKKPRVATVLKPSLKVDSSSGTTRLHGALRAGDYKRAVQEINRWGLLNARETDTLWTPLHCLSYCSWEEEEFFNLLEMLLKGGCSPNARSSNNKTFLDYLSGDSNLDVCNFKGIFKLLSCKGYIFYNPNYPLPSFLLDHAEASGISVEERVATIADYFSHIPHQNKQKAAEELFVKLLKSMEFREEELAEIIETLLMHFEEDFDPSQAADRDGRNLMCLTVLNRELSPAEMIKILKVLKKYPIDIHNSGRNRSLFENLMASSYSFERKKEILKKMIHARIPCSVTDDADSDKPTPFQLVETLLNYNMTCEEISEVVHMALREDWYREYLLMKLIANCFGIDQPFTFEDKEASLTGCLTNMTGFYQWLENDSKEFYETHAQSLTHAEMFLSPIKKTLSIQAVRAMGRISGNSWCKILQTTGETLSSAFAHRGLRKFTPLKRLLNDDGFFAFVPSLAAGKDARHSVGLLFKPPEILFCNKGDDLAKQSGISRHYISNTKAKVVLTKSLENRDLYGLIREHFETRIKGGKTNPFIVLQKSQDADNCPVASLSSLELGILITLLEEKLPDVDTSIVIEIARGIKSVHRQQRRKKVLEEYETFHQSPDCNIPSYLQHRDILKEKCPEYFS